MTIIDCSSGYDNLNVIENPHFNHICKSVWQLQVQQCTLGVTPATDMLKKKIDKVFKGLPNVFGIADDILIIRYAADGRDHDRTLRQVMQICC